ncbi:DUF3592 domain-containing protein [Nonomuraea cavernae]|nr:DUF3592 domain-containing protein [Nonomuraea cavernae]MCA2187195.1 hypothetical protein [Nonomuraea cavernae]
MLFILGLANLACGVWILRRPQRFRARGVRVPGVVTGLERSSDPDSNACYPVFRFTTRDGQRVEITSRYGESKPPQPGDRVTVLLTSQIKRIGGGEPVTAVAHSAAGPVRTRTAASGLPPIRLHDLCRGAATLAPASGTELKVAQGTLGHASIMLTADT